MSHYQLFINGQYQAASSGKTDKSINPATGEVFATVELASAEDAVAAVDSADQAFKSWKDTLPSYREMILLKAAEVMTARSAELKDILIDEGGSTMLKAGYEVTHTPAFLRSMAGECRRVTGETYASDYPGVKSYSIRRPLGVVLAISPFNFPLLLGIRKIGWAIAAGNTVVLKPSEATPVIALKIAEIFTEAGLPPGVLNVTPAHGADLKDTLIKNAKVKKVTFTGSTKVGRSIAVSCAKYGKPITLEMGGKNPLVVLNDADIDYAVNAAAFSNFMNQGQVCMTGSRVIVEAGIYDEFVAKFTSKVQGIKFGNPREPGVIVGPLIRSTQPAFIQDQVEKSVSDGAKITVGGSFNGNVYRPTVVADVTEDMALFSTECFGPVASVIKANDAEHALALANNSCYGLTSAVLTNDLQKTLYFVENLESGMVHINGPTIRDETTIPFGGVKDSGMGREGGQFAMNEFTELKWVTIQTGQQKFPF
ncbi:aldehyde dehydrogenase family protein [Paraglaciecola arctica]|uniref:aldehyde dehydrogenase family protein n=1 Tax=Paraglaciecola arctica TaxID=1128911 RepID=UPI001C07C831|nr:aldehyde dehydrogenase family protein [Paraglaciecola arctica]MBU3002965.1 aldehyde dehydrogenase family protein [Paraglaciecola arctica]